MQNEDRRLQIAHAFLSSCLPRLFSGSAAKDLLLETTEDETGVAPLAAPSEPFDFAQAKARLLQLLAAGSISQFRTFVFSSFFAEKRSVEE
jgi:hypothetical protein